MSVKPIQDDLPVSEVGENPKVNKTDIDSQLLPLPPMTMGEFEELVQNVVKDVTRPLPSETIRINEILPPAPDQNNFEIQNIVSAIERIVVPEALQMPSLQLEGRPPPFLGQGNFPNIEIPQAPEKVDSEKTLIVDTENPTIPETPSPSISETPTPPASETSSLSVSETPSSSVSETLPNIETSDASVPEVSVETLKESFSNISDLETRALDLIAQLESKIGGSGESQEATGLTTRDYVDQVLGGERNLSGDDLTGVANFLSNKTEQDIRFQRNDEGTIDVFEGSELVSTMTEPEVNGWIADTERSEASKNDEQVSKDLTIYEPSGTQKEAVVEIAEDTTTQAHLPFSFSGQATLFINDAGSSIQQIDLYNELQTSFETNGKLKNYYLFKFDLDTGGNITGSELVFTNKNNDDTIPIGLEELVEFSGSGDSRVQTAIYFPFAVAFQGHLQMLTLGGIYKLFKYCITVDGNKEDVWFPNKLI